jgi:hypothetical protein
MASDTEEDDDGPPIPRAPRPWAAVLLGAAAGLGMAAIALGAWSAWRAATAPTLPAPREAARVDLFRLPSGGAREALLLPAGPDAAGEPRLAERIFGSADARELVSLFLANVSREEPWDVDLAQAPLRCRAGAASWEEIGRLDGPFPGLPPTDELRLRSLGAGATRLRVEPGTLRQVLLALPPGRKLAELTDVQWGERPLTRDRLDLERVRRFREDPAGTFSGR